MGTFDTLQIAGSGLGAHQVWLDTIAHNLANANTVRATTDTAFQAQMPITRPQDGGGVEVTGIALSDAEGIVVNDPDHPLADAQGNVRMPAMDTASQMTQLIMAQRGFQASSQVTKYAQETYTAAIGIGR